MPWPRTQVAQLVAKLSEKGAAVIVRMFFSRSDRTSPANVLPLWTSDLPELKILQSKAGSCGP